MTGGAQANRDRMGGGGKGGSSKSGGSSDKGHYHGETVRTVKEAAIRHGDARVQVEKTRIGTKERADALKELGDARDNLESVK